MKGNVLVLPMAFQGTYGPATIDFLEILAGVFDCIMIPQDNTSGILLPLCQKAANYSSALKDRKNIEYVHVFY